MVACCADRSVFYCVLLLRAPRVSTDTIHYCVLFGGNPLGYYSPFQSISGSSTTSGIALLSPTAYQRSSASRKVVSDSSAS